MLIVILLLLMFVLIVVFLVQLFWIICTIRIHVSYLCINSEEARLIFTMLQQREPFLVMGGMIEL